LIKTILVITTPRDNLSDVSSRSTLQLIHNVLNTKHPNSYMIYTLDQSSNDQLSYRTELFNNRVCLLFIFIFLFQSIFFLIDC
jgi:hypothetical protein